jgi:hypothetical protein
MHMQTYALNSAIDTRRWSQTEESPLREGPRPEPPVPTREDEQKYSQTAPQREREEHKDDDSD